MRFKAQKQSYSLIATNFLFIYRSNTRDIYVNMNRALLANLKHLTTKLCELRNGYPRYKSPYLNYI